MLAVLLAFLAGAADLAAEMLVLRAGRFGLGASAEATALLLSLSLAGFGAGAALSRRLARARTFAICRISSGLLAAGGSIATYAAAATPGPLPQWPPPALAVATAPAFAIPAGASLPLLYSWTGGLARRAAALFAANALGSVAGVVLGGVVGPIHGGASICAVGILAANLGIGLLGLLRAGVFWEPQASSRLVEAAGTPDATAAWAVAFSAGAATIACEALFGRIAPFFLDERSDAVATVLAAAMLGLSAGGAMCGICLRHYRPVSILVVALSAIAFCGPLALLGLELLSRERWISSPQTTAQWIGARALVGGALFAPLFFFIGVLSPVAFAFARGGGRERAATVNLAYALGALLPAWLVPASLQLGASTPLLIGCIGFVGLPAGFAVLGVRALPILLPAAAAAFLGSGPITARVPPFRAKPWLAPLEAREDAVGLAAVVLDRRLQELALFTNAFRAAATGDDYRYTRSLAHIPSLLAAKAPERVGVIAVGTGSTAAAALRHRSVKRLEMVEISPQVFSLLPWFRPASDALFPERAGEPRRAGPGGAAPAPDPRVRFVVDDGRRYVAKGGEPFDLLLLEPLLPDTPSAFPFYTSQFYALGSARLAKGGILAQWIPIHATEPLAFRALVSTFSQAFPERAAFLVGNSLLLLGSNEPMRLSTERLAEALQSPELAADLRRSGCAAAGDIVAQCVLGNAGMAAFASRHPLSDREPRIERIGVLDVADLLAFERENLGSLLRAREGEPNDPLPGMAALPAGEQEARRAAGLAYLRARRAVVSGESARSDPGDGARALSSLSETTPHPFAALDGQRLATRDAVVEGRGSLARGDVTAAIRVFERAAAASRDPVIWLGLACAYARSDRASDAAFAEALALALEPNALAILPNAWPETRDPRIADELARLREPALALIGRIPNYPRTLVEVAEGLWSSDPPRRVATLVVLARERDRLGFEIERFSEALVSRTSAETQAALTVADALADPTLAGTRAKLAAAVRR